MEIIKNNGKIIINKVDIRLHKKDFRYRKLIESYNITVLDNINIERLRGNLNMYEYKNCIKHKLYHNSNNKALISYILNELKKIKLIE